jgi:hypothetical protein
MIAHERLHGGHERMRNHQQVVLEHAREVEKRLATRHDLAGLDAAEVHLRQPAAQFGLAPAALSVRLFQFDAQVGREAVQPHRSDGLLYIFTHAENHRVLEGIL